MTRGRKAQGAPKTELFHLRLSADESAKMNRCSTHLGITPSEFIRKLINDYVLKKES